MTTKPFRRKMVPGLDISKTTTLVLVLNLGFIPLFFLSIFNFPLDFIKSLHVKLVINVIN